MQNLLNYDLTDIMKDIMNDSTQRRKIVIGLHLRNVQSPLNFQRVLEKALCNMLQDRQIQLKSQTLGNLVFKHRGLKSAPLSLKCIEQVLRAEFCFSQTF